MSTSSTIATTRKARPRIPDKPLEAARRLMDRAEEQGFLTVDDVLELFPEAERRLRELEELMMFLYEQGVEIITPEEDGAATALSLIHI